MPSPVQRIASQPAPAATDRPRQEAEATAFAAVLAARRRGDLRFSSHAQQRLARRGIDLGPGDLDRLTAAVDQASAKGGRESLILLDELALVVSIDKRTVITAMNTDAAQGNVFTNVDSVVIAPDKAR